MVSKPRGPIKRCPRSLACTPADGIAYAGFPRTFFGNTWERCSLVEWTRTPSRARLVCLCPGEGRHCYEACPDAPLEFVNLAFAPSWWRHFPKQFSPPLEPASGGRSRFRRRVDFLADATKRIEERLHALLARNKHDQALLTETMATITREWEASAGNAGDATKPVPEWLGKVVRSFGHHGWTSRTHSPQRMNADRGHAWLSCRRIRHQLAPVRGNCPNDLAAYSLPQGEKIFQPSCSAL